MGSSGNTVLREENGFSPVPAGQGGDDHLGELCFSTEGPPYYFEETSLERFETFDDLMSQTTSRSSQPGSKPSKQLGPCQGLHPAPAKLRVNLVKKAVPVSLAKKEMLPLNSATEPLPVNHLLRLLGNHMVSSGSLSGSEPSLGVEEYDLFPNDFEEVDPILLPLKEETYDGKRQLTRLPNPDSFSAQFHTAGKKIPVRPSKASLAFAHHVLQKADDENGDLLPTTSSTDSHQQLPGKTCSWRRNAAPTDAQPCETLRRSNTEERKNDNVNHDFTQQTDVTLPHSPGEYFPKSFKYTCAGRMANAQVQRDHTNASCASDQEPMTSTADYSKEQPQSQTESEKDMKDTDEKQTFMKKDVCAHQRVEFTDSLCRSPPWTHFYPSDVPFCLKNNIDKKQVACAGPPSAADTACPKVLGIPSTKASNELGDALRPTANPKRQTLELPQQPRLGEKQRRLSGPPLAAVLHPQAIHKPIYNAVADNIPLKHSGEIPPSTTLNVNSSSARRCIHYKWAQVNVDAVSVKILEHIARQQDASVADRCPPLRLRDCVQRICDIDSLVNHCDLQETIPFLLQCGFVSPSRCAAASCSRQPTLPTAPLSFSHWLTAENICRCILLEIPFASVKSIYTQFVLVVTFYLYVSVCVTRFSCI